MIKNIIMNLITFFCAKNSNFRRKKNFELLRVEKFAKKLLFGISSSKIVEKIRENVDNFKILIFKKVV